MLMNYIKFRQIMSRIIVIIVFVILLLTIDF